MKDLITLIATTTLSIILLAMVAVLLAGLFDSRIDNTKVLEIIAPAFQTVVGGFIGLVTGIKIGTDNAG